MDQSKLKHQARDWLLTKNVDSGKIHLGSFPARLQASDGKHRHTLDDLARLHIWHLSGRIRCRKCYSDFRISDLPYRFPLWMSHVVPVHGLHVDLRPLVTTKVKLVILGVERKGLLGCLRDSGRTVPHDWWHVRFDQRHH